ncbi:MAG: hypothetical protein SVY53_13820 [Chloroflexota bacterium]|nr:hypothetical protein [Chloroflexota bacterium]
MGQELDELRDEIKATLPRRKVESIEEKDDRIVVTIKTGGRMMDPQEERQIKMLAYRMLSKEANVQIV